MPHDTLVLLFDGRVFSFSFVNDHYVENWKNLNNFNLLKLVSLNRDTYIIYRRLTFFYTIVSIILFLKI